MSDDVRHYWHFVSPLIADQIVLFWSSDFPLLSIPPFVRVQDYGDDFEDYNEDFEDEIDLAPVVAPVKAPVSTQPVVNTTVTKTPPVASRLVFNTSISIALKKKY
jgi:hypothetical protein